MQIRNCLLFLLAPLYSLCQTYPLTGTIINETGQPVPGAIISMKHAAITTTSDIKGVFSMVLNKTNDTLVISASGYQTIHEPINNRVVFTITLMKNLISLEEVVLSTGYQDISEKHITGSFNTVSKEKLNLQPGHNILNRLNGITSSVLFPLKNDAPVLTIRGPATLLGPKDPLVILDNFPYEGDWNNINPNDIESITILKDAAAAAIWGTRAGNGVLVIKTKKAKYNQPLTIEFNANYTTTSKPNLMKISTLEASDYIDLEKMLFENGYYDDLLQFSPFNAVTPVVDILFQERNGLLDPLEAKNQIDAFRKNNSRKNYMDLFYETPLNQQYAINMRGGSGNSNYLFSAGYDNNVNELENRYKRYTLKSAYSFKPVSRLDIDLGLLYTQSQDKTGKPELSAIKIDSWNAPYLNFQDDFGYPQRIALNYSHRYTDTAGGGKLLSWDYYPLTDYKHNYTTTHLTNTVFNAGLRYRFSNSLAASIRYIYELQNLESNNIKDHQSYAARSMVNNYTQIDPVTGKITYGVPPGGISGLSNDKISSQNFRLHADFNRTWKLHSLNAIGGTEIRETNYTGHSNILYAYNENGLTVGSVNPVDPFPTYVYGFSSYINQGAAVRDRTNRFVSFFSNSAYSFKERYILTVSARSDASNLFGLKTNDKWKLIWSAGAAWDITGERFMKSGPFDKLKFRATYGYTGNADQSKSAIFTMAYLNNASNTGLPIAQARQYPNPHLRWEKQSITNLGLDFELKNHRIWGSIEYYIKKGKDLFGNTPLDYTAGQGRNGIITNASNLQGHGVNTDLGFKIMEGKKNWLLNLIFNVQKDKVIDFYKNTLRAVTFTRDGDYSTGLEGYPVYSIISYKWGGLDNQGNPRGYLNDTLSYNYDEMATSDIGISAIEFNGPALPVCFGSVLNTFSWKQFSVTASIAYKLGYYFRKRTSSYNILFASGIGSNDDFNNRWQKPGDEAQTDIPSLIYPVNGPRDAFYNNSSATVRRADNIRLQFITASYELNFKQSPADRTIKALRLYANGSNLGLLWKANKENFDPEYDGRVPPPASFTVGLNMTF